MMVNKRSRTLVISRLHAFLRLGNVILGLCANAFIHLLNVALSATSIIHERIGILLMLLLSNSIKYCHALKDEHVIESTYYSIIDELLCMTAENGRNRAEDQNGY